MRVFACISFLNPFVMPVLLITPVLLAPNLFAQGTSSGGVSYESGGATASFEVVNQSAEGAGSFVGAGVPEYFIGTEDVFNDSSSSASRQTANSAQRRTTSTRTTRRATTATSRRRAGMTAGAGRTGNLSSQSIPSVCSFDSETPSFLEPLQTKIASHLNQIQGIQDGQITLSGSPSGTIAILSGTVVSERERQVAEVLLLLEPGIDHVENLLEVR